MQVGGHTYTRVYTHQPDIRIGETNFWTTRWWWQTRTDGNCICSKKAETFPFSLCALCLPTVNYPTVWLPSSNIFLVVVWFQLECNFPRNKGSCFSLVHFCQHFLIEIGGAITIYCHLKKKCPPRTAWLLLFPKCPHFSTCEVVVLIVTLLSSLSFRGGLVSSCWSIKTKEIFFFFSFPGFFLCQLIFPSCFVVCPGHFTTPNPLKLHNPCAREGSSPFFSPYYTEKLQFELFLSPLVGQLGVNDVVAQQKKQKNTFRVCDYLLPSSNTVGSRFFFRSSIFTGVLLH